MAFTKVFQQSLTVTVGNPTKKTEIDNVAVNTDALRERVVIAHWFNDTGVTNEDGFLKGQRTAPAWMYAKTGGATAKYFGFYLDELASSKIRVHSAASTAAPGMGVGKIVQTQIVADGDWFGLGASAGRFVFSSTANPDTITVTDATLVAATITATTINAASATISSNASTLSFDTAATIDTSGNNILTLNSGTAHTDVTCGTFDITGILAVSGTTTLTGNVGIGRTTEAWNTAIKPVAIGAEASLAGYVTGGAGNSLFLTHNAWVNSGGDWQYITNDETAQLQMTDGMFLFRSAAAGTGTATFAEKMRMTQAGQLLVGHTASVAVGGVGPVIQAHTASGDQMGIYQWSADAVGPYFFLSKSRSATKGTMTIVQDDDVLGVIRAVGADGVDLTNGASSIIFRVNGTPAENDIPGEIELATFDGGVQTGSLILDAAGHTTSLFGSTWDADAATGLPIVTAGSSSNSLGMNLPNVSVNYDKALRITITSVANNLRAGTLIVHCSRNGNNVVCAEYRITFSADRDGSTTTASRYAAAVVEWTYGTAGDWVAKIAGDVSISSSSTTTLVIDIDNTDSAGVNDYALYMLNAVGVTQIAAATT